MTTTTSSPPPTPSRYKRINRSTSERPTPTRSSSRMSSPPASSRPAGASLPRQKIQALEAFVKFGRKGKEKSIPPEYPPSSWFQEPPTSQAASKRAEGSDIHTVLDETWSNAGTKTPPKLTSSFSQPAPAGYGVQRVNAHGTTSAPAIVDNGGDRTPTNDRRSISVPGTPTAEAAPPPEPITLARRIQALLSSRSPPAPPTTAPSMTYAPTSSASVTAGPQTVLDFEPPSDPPPQTTSDPGLMSMLSNVSLMNGSLDKGRQSVFAMLDRMRISRRSPPTAAAPDEISDVAELLDDDDNESVMLYGPLVPDEDSEVEIAASDVMSTYDDGETIEYERPAQRISILEALEARSPGRSPLALPPTNADAGPSSAGEAAEETSQDGEGDGEGKTESKTWFETWKDKMVEGGKVFTGKMTESGKAVTDKVSEGGKVISDKVSEGREIVKTKIRWVPSPDKISFQANWWGYRLYLPPPVLEVLNNKRLEAAKRAAIITTALQWLLGHVPLTILPPQFRPGLLIAQRLVPYLGYIGAFVAWSWGAMKSFDKGYGIVLTATWILPVALIPGTWEATEAIFPPQEPSNERGDAPP
ncbi:hypothetical protein OF83DRAFT_1130888 [Amylostereum chailletii]|nr:hypothetical protein OF83DRAFT_1130888 [Amylostereum chailletii]